MSNEKAKRDKEDFAWEIVTYKALDKKGNPLWESWFNKEKMEEKKKFYRDSGQPAKFYQEYMMEVQSAEDSIFNMKHIKFWRGHFNHDEEGVINYIITDDDAKPVNVFVGVDPATDSMRREADFSVIMAVAVDMDNTVYVLDYVRERGLPVLAIPGEGKKGIVDYMFDYAHMYHPQLFVIEDTTMSRPVFQALVSESRRRNDFSVKFKEEKPGTRMSKRDRIQGVLSQRLVIGALKIKESHFDLQHEIVTFGPRMSHDDTIDALAYACKFAHPPHGITSTKDGFKRHVSKPKSWVVA